MCRRYGERCPVGSSHPATILLSIILPYVDLFLLPHHKGTCRSRGAFHDIFCHSPHNLEVSSRSPYNMILLVGEWSITGQAACITIVFASQQTQIAHTISICWTTVSDAHKLVTRRPFPPKQIRSFQGSSHREARRRSVTMRWALYENHPDVYAVVVEFKKWANPINNGLYS